MLQRFENDADADDLVFVLDKDILGFDVAHIGYSKVSRRLQKMIRERDLSTKNSPKNPKKAQSVPQYARYGKSRCSIMVDYD